MSEKSKFKFPIRIKNKGAFILLIVLAIGGFFWFFKGEAFLNSLFAEPMGKYLENTAQTLRQTDPEAARVLEEFARQRDVNEWAARAFQAREQAGGLSGVRDLAIRIEQDRVAYEMVIAEIASRPGAFRNDQERDSFILAYATYFEPLEVLDGRMVDEEARFLRENVGNAAHWNVAKDDPMALTMLRAGVFDGNDSLLSFYSEHRDWLHTALEKALFQFYVNVSDEPSENLEFLRNAATRTMQFYPASKAFAEVGEDEGFLFAAVFLEYAHILAPTVTEWRIPPDEAAAVVFANQDQYRAVPVDESVSAGDIRQGMEQARELAYLRDNRTFLWNKAQEEALVLRFYRDSAGAGERLLQRYEGLPSFVYSQYPDESVQVIRAIDIYGDLALYYLQRYAESERMKEFLRKDGVGVRILPLIFREGDRAFDMVEENMRWLDRYVNLDGTPREGQDWLMTLPFVGAPLQVINNWRNGYPSTWGEIGWAGLDVALIVLLVAPLPTPPPGARTATRAVVAGTKSSVRVGSQGAVLLGRGAAIQTARTGGSLLTRYAAYASALAARTAQGAGGVVKATWTQARKAAYVLRNPYVRKGVFAVYVTVVLNERTIPGLPALGTAAGETVGRALNSVGQAAGNAFSAALTNAFGANSALGRSAIAATLNKGVWVVMLFFSGFILFRNLEWR